ncbi:HAMP domain-containing sensor histidine kinase [Malonomonas rubra]|uniref:sensor histidine kinase n=1 Tax=Malonomonas rubra TaxID=57040 RepID=UPI0026F2805D|nr:ATP-binding protein [Malonomonas rubra]
MTSIRRQLLRWLLIGQLVAVILSSALTYYYVRGELAGLFDDRLRQLAYSVPILGSYQLPPISNSLKDSDADFVIQVWLADGEQILYLNRKEGAPVRATEGFSTHFSGGMLWRSFGLQRNDRFVQTSQPYSDRVEMTTEVALGAITPVLLLIIVLGVLVWISIGRGLKPLHKITEAIHQRQPNALEPLPEASIPVEIFPLIHALNQLLGRLDEALGKQRKFIADAAHELRTPLTAIQLQAQLLERTPNGPEREKVLDQIKAGIKRAGRLVQQLLTLARLDPEDRQRPFSEVNLSELSKSVIRDLTPAALRKRIDLGFCEKKPLSIWGDAETLRTLLTNLIDNAIRYTPANGQVDVSLIHAGNRAKIEVKDTGPGIPPAERDRAFSRFHRLSTNGEFGSGLGLAIAKEIVEQHQGQIALDTGNDERGLRIVIELPTRDQQR